MQTEFNGKSNFCLRLTIKMEVNIERNIRFFTVLFLVTRPSSRNEAREFFVMIRTLLLTYCHHARCGGQGSNEITPPLPILSQFFNGAPVVLEFLQLLLNRSAPCFFGLPPLRLPSGVHRIAILAMIRTLLLLKCKLFCYHASVNSCFYLHHHKGRFACNKKSRFEFPDI